jgi:hypothetical protein
MVDVFSRYAIVERVTAGKAENMAWAFSERILIVCNPKLIITDGGSEFKAGFARMLSDLKIDHHVTTPQHSEGHGIVERFNRAFTKTLSHALKDQPKDQWHMHLAAALIAYNCTPHRVHHFTPMQVFFRTLETSLLPSSIDHEAEVESKRGSALELVLARRAMKQVVRENQQAYHKAMDSSSTEAKRKSRSLSVGDTVLVFRETGLKLKDKWSDRFDGPFVVVEKLGSNIYMVLRMGSDDKPQREHIDNLVAAPVLPEAITVHAAASTEAEAEPTGEPVAGATSGVITESGKPSSKKFEVELIAGQEGGKYLVKWKGYDAATWEDEENLDCARLVKNLLKLSTKEKARLRKNTAIEADKRLASLSELHNVYASARFLNADLSKLHAPDAKTNT